MNLLKKGLLKHMLADNLTKIQLPNKDLLILHESSSKPALSEKYVRSRLMEFYKDDDSKATELWAYLQAIPQSDLQTRTSIRHLCADSYIENESESGDPAA